MDKIEKLKKGKESYANADRLFASGKYSEAMAALKDALKYDPSYSREAGRWYRDGKASLDAKKYQVAMEGFKMAIALDLNQVEAHKALVEQYIDAETLDEFKNVYTEYLRTDGRNPVFSGTLPEFLYSKGVDYKNKNEFQLAKRCFEMTQFFAPVYKDAASQMKLCDDGFARMKNAREAQKEYLTADAAFKAGKIDKALDGFARSVQLDPSLKSKAVDWYKQGQQNAELGKYPRVHSFLSGQCYLGLQ